MVGWFNFVLGRWTYKWEVVQQSHDKRIDSWKTNKQWAITILLKFSMICWDLWDFHKNVRKSDYPLFKM